MAYIPKGCTCLGCLVLTEEDQKRAEFTHFCKGGRLIKEDCQRCQWLLGGPEPTEEEEKES